MIVSYFTYNPYRVGLLLCIVTLKCHDNRYRREIFSIVISDNTINIVIIIYCSIRSTQIYDISKTFHIILVPVDCMYTVTVAKVIS